MSAMKMTVREEIAALAVCLEKAEDAASHAAMYLNDVRTGEYAAPREESGKPLPAASLARLLGMTVAARHMAVAAVEEADETMTFLLQEYQAQAGDEALPPLAEVAS